MATMTRFSFLLFLAISPPVVQSQISVECTTDVRECPDGSMMRRDPELHCEFPDCPSDAPIACTADVHECPDGSFVSRDSENGCQFPDCPDDDAPLFACTADVRECPNGSFVSRDPANGCQFAACPSDPLPIACTADVHVCPDGTFVSRDPDDECNFPACPTDGGDGLQFCTADVHQCPDGSFVSRDPENDCEFVPCPPLQEVCCSLADRPQLNTEDPICCPDGSWAGNIGNGSASCGADGLIDRERSGPICAPDCDICPCGFSDGCNDCVCISDDILGLVPGCTKRFCVDERTLEPSCFECPIKAPPTIKPPVPVSCEDCPCGYFDGCNNCDCAADGTLPICTLMFCDDDVLEEPRCNDCPLSPPPPPTAPNPDDGVSCETCSCGYFDGCNNCGCDERGFPFCTQRACSFDDLEAPQCHACAPRNEEPAVSCDHCPCGYFDGCNQCHCEDDGSAYCTEIFCQESETPQCTECPDEFDRPCPKDARVCRDGTFVYRVAADGCVFEPCPCSNLFCRLAQLFWAVLSFLRGLRRN